MLPVGWASGSSARERVHGFPQPLHVAHRWDTEDAFVFPVEVRGIVVPHAIGSTGCVEVFAQHETAGLLEPQLLLELQGTHRRDSLELGMEPRDAHAQLTRDLLNAFVGEQRRFDKPVLVAPYPGGVARALGFVTQESLHGLGLEGHVTVYLPQSYNFAGALLIFPTSAVTPIAADSADVMAFIVSGGVTAPPGSLLKAGVDSERSITAVAARP